MYFVVWHRASRSADSEIEVLIEFTRSSHGNLIDLDSGLLHIIRIGIVGPLDREF